MFLLTLVYLSGTQNNVVVVSGERGRKDFFNAKGLDLQEGFRILSGMVSVLDHRHATPTHQSNFLP
jgi:hypothetical protein